jgi:hypothetical protein
MASDGSTSIADMGDRHRRYMALALLSMGLMFVLQAAREWIEPGSARDALRYGVLGFMVVALGFMVPIVAWKVRNLWGADSGAWAFYRGADGFIADARAHIASWTVTLLFLVIVGTLDEMLESAPPAFAIQATLAVLLVSFGIAFLVLDRAESGA